LGRRAREGIQGIEKGVHNMMLRYGLRTEALTPTSDN